MRFILYVIHVLTEMLPVSSSGHEHLYMLLAQAAPLSLAHVIFGNGVIAGIIFSYFADFLWRTARFYPIQSLKVFGYACIANSVTFVMYMLCIGYFVSVPVWLGFGITALILYLFTLWQYYVDDTGISITWLSLPIALGLGLIQGLALVPGISRLATTYSVSRMCGASHEQAFGFSWLLQLQLLAGSFLLDGFQYLKQYGFVVHDVSPSFIMLSGILFFLGYGVLRMTAWLLRTKKTYLFAFYETCITYIAWYFI